MKQVDLIFVRKEVEFFEAQMQRRLRELHKELVGYEVIYTGRFAPQDKKSGRKAVIFDVWLGASGNLLCDITFLSVDGKSYLRHWQGGYSFEYLTLTSRRVFDTIVGQTRPHR